MCGETIKRCSCGREYTRETWARAPFVGELDDGVEVLELRNCACRSTMAIVVRAADVVHAP